MNSGLQNIFDQTIEQFKNDDRFIGGWHFGSIAKGNADKFSDVDPVFLVKEKYFDEVDAELTATFKKICPNIRLWWAEDFNDQTIKNYAILLESDDVYQYDISIIKETSINNGMANVFFKNCKNEDIIFDKNGVIKKNIEQFNCKAVSEQTDLNYIKHEIEKYWLFAFISVKYFMRGRVFKIFYARDELRNVHLNVLKMLIGSSKASWDWWPESIEKNLSIEKQNDFLAYFGSSDINDMRLNFKAQMNLFSKDAKELCSLNHIAYPQNLEDTIIKYVDKHIFQK